jgi:hypothetical protein
VAAASTTTSPPAATNASASAVGDADRFSVRVQADGDEYAVLVQYDVTVAALVRQLDAELGTGPRRRLTCDSLQLRDDDSLADCGVAPGSLLRLLPRNVDEERAAANAATALQRQLQAQLQQRLAQQQAQMEQQHTQQRQLDAQKASLQQQKTLLQQQLLDANAAASAASSSNSVSASPTSRPAAPASASGAAKGARAAAATASTSNASTTSPASPPATADGGSSAASASSGTDASSTPVPATSGDSSANGASSGARTPNASAAAVAAASAETFEVRIEMPDRSVISELVSASENVAALRKRLALGARTRLRYGPHTLTDTKPLRAAGVRRNSVLVVHDEAERFGDLVLYCRATPTPPTAIAPAVCVALECMLDQTLEHVRRTLVQKLGGSVVCDRKFTRSHTHVHPRAGASGQTSCCDTTGARYRQSRRRCANSGALTCVGDVCS